MKAVIIFNHFQIQDGVARSAIGIANALAKKEVDVTLRPLFRFDKSMCSLLDERVRIKSVFKGYFRGFARLVALLPMHLLNRWIINDKYDMEIGLCVTLPIRIVAAYPQGETILEKINKTHCYGSDSHASMRFAWMHGYDAGISLRREYEKIGRVICVSKFNSDCLRKETNGEFTIDYAYNLLDDDMIRQKGKQPISIVKTNKITFVSVARMSPEKGYLRLLEIFRRLKSDGYDFVLWLIGDGPQRGELEKTAKNLNLTDSVLFLGEQSNPHAFTSKADVFICSSFMEGYSTACTEAIMLGTPVLTTCVSGGEEIIQEAECGMLVGMDNEDLYQGIRSILDNPKVIDKWKEILMNTRDKFSYACRMERLYRVLGLDKPEGDL